MTYFFKKIKPFYCLSFFFKCGPEYQIIFKEEEESVEILKIVGLIDNIDEHNRIYTHVWKNINQK